MSVLCHSIIISAAVLNPLFLQKNIPLTIMQVKANVNISHLASTTEYAKVYVLLPLDLRNDNVSDNSTQRDSVFFLMAHSFAQKFSH